MPISNLFHKGTSEMSSFRKVVKNPSLKPILVRIGKKFAETIILSIVPRFCNPCTALTVPFAIAWLQLVVHHPMNSGIPFHMLYLSQEGKRRVRNALHPCGCSGKGRAEISANPALVYLRLRGYVPG